MVREGPPSNTRMEGFSERATLPLLSAWAGRTQTRTRQSGPVPLCRDALLFIKRFQGPCRALLMAISPLKRMGFCSRHLSL